MTIKDEKYIVFNREKFEFMMKVIDQGWDETIEVKDAVVIRTQDTFAGPALHSYAASIATAARVIGVVDPLKAKGLMGIADYFSERATEADDKAQVDADKLPD